MRRGGAPVQHCARAPQLIGRHEERGALTQLGRLALAASGRRFQHGAVGCQHKHVLRQHALLLHALQRNSAGTQAGLGTWPGGANSQDTSIWVRGRRIRDSELGRAPTAPSRFCLRFLLTCRRLCRSPTCRMAATQRGWIAQHIKLFRIE